MRYPIPLRMRLRHWWQLRRREIINNAIGTLAFASVFAITGTMDYADELDAEREAAELSGRAHAAALAALLNGRAITNVDGTWAAKCENVVTVTRAKATDQ